MGVKWRLSTFKKSKSDSTADESGSKSSTLRKDLKSSSTDLVAASQTQSSSPSDVQVILIYKHSGAGGSDTMLEIAGCQFLGRRLSRLLYRLKARKRTYQYLCGKEGLSSHD
jgi:hypothetical protein